MMTRLHKAVLAAAFAALLLSSCAKVETLSPRVLIGFQVGRSASQTKASMGGSLIDESCSSFWCNAWYTPTAGSVQRFMDTDEVVPDETPGVNVWAPVRDYFWPHTGTINFFSYASARPLGNKLSVTNNGSTFTITNYTVTSADNILVADAVYNATRTNANASLEPAGENDPTGVPALFRHVLASVAMDMMLKTTAQKATVNTTYEVIVTNVTLHNFRDQGSLTLTNTYSGGSAYGTQAWTPASDGTQVGWVPTGTAHDVDLTPDSQSSIVLDAGETESDDVIFLGRGAVMPQSLEGTLSISITLTIRSKHGATIYNEDKDVVLSASLDPAPGAAWKMNQKIHYHIEIDPVTTTLRFDPAVGEWDVVNGGTIQL
ncbi:MAG: hypothetical protein IKR69_05940 [Bacteroidales bacterium]|nr:hypothetical protein [Bacteroidales bacterium]